VLRDDSGNRGGGRGAPRNVLGEPLDICSITPEARKSAEATIWIRLREEFERIAPRPKGN
jgi:hypothetical protein